MFFRLSLLSQLILVVIAVFLFHQFIPLSAVEYAYTISIILKELLTFILPFMIFFFVTYGIISLQHGAPVTLLVMLGAIFISNTLVALSAYGVISFVLPMMSNHVEPASLIPVCCVEPLWRLGLVPLVRSEHALMLAIIVGLIMSFVRIKPLVHIIHTGKRWIEFLLVRCFIPLLPLYILGFLLKIAKEGIFVLLIQYYSGAFLLIVGMQFCALLSAYYLANGFSLRAMTKALMNALPSYVTAFSTMSSTATIPVSITAAEKNTHNSPLAHVAMPIMANVHLMGDAISVPVLAISSLYLFKGILPSFGDYVTFVLYFCTSMFAVSGVPGGGIIIMTPILISLFHFTPEMVGVITTLYLLMDCFGTGANVMGDGALIIIVNKMLHRLRGTPRILS